jgi:lipoyltransferase 1
MSQWVNSVIKEVVVYRSLSHNVYANLALEEWMMRNVDHQGKRTLLLWRNSPCVVIGRFQNPWMECNVSKLESIPAAMARRKSGGGAVYHDMGNLNCSFFAHRADYNRTRNLQLVCRAVNRHWEGVDLRVGERNDIWCHGRKVSGSAARIAKDHTYHHFTLLIDSNMDDLHSVLKPCPKMSFQTTTSATRSMPSPTTNIKTINSCIEYDEVCHVVAREFYDIHGINHNQVVSLSCCVM